MSEGERDFGHSMGLSHKRRLEVLQSEKYKVLVIRVVLTDMSYWDT